MGQCYDRWSAGSVRECEKEKLSPTLRSFDFRILGKNLQ